jgi:zinc and cadmium transporter
VPRLVSFAIGSLLGAAFLALLPHALSAGSEIDPHNIFLTVLLGVLLFFLLEKMVIWRHCHSDSCEAHTHTEHHHTSAANLILVGDGMHNLMDGVLIAAAFMTDIDLGIVTSLAVIAHEIPQEVGDFAILLQGGFSRSKALYFNVLSSLATLVGGVVAYFLLAQVTHITPYILALAAASFIYIAVADLIPGLHKKVDIGSTIQQIVLILAGVIVIYFAHSSLH